jgi:hypothetical protein
VRIGVIADSHVSVDERRFEPEAWHNPYRLADSLDRFAAALTHPLLEGAELVAVLGDLVHWGDRASLRAVVDAAAACAKPVILLSGNHDVIERGVRLEDEVAAASPRDVWSPCIDPLPDAIVAPFVRAGLGLQVVEVMEVRPDDGRPFRVEARTVLPGATGGAGIVLTHFPLLSFRWRAVEAELLYSGNLRDLAAEPDLDRGWGATLVLNGHLHIHAVRVKESTCQISFGALVEAPYEVSVVDVTARDDELEIAYECASMHDVTEAKVPALDPSRGAHRIALDTAATPTG